MTFGSTVCVILRNVNVNSQCFLFVVKMMLMIRKCLNVCIQNAGDDEFASSNKENSSVRLDIHNYLQVRG